MAEARRHAIAPQLGERTEPAFSSLRQAAGVCFALKSQLLIHLMELAVMFSQRSIRRPFFFYIYIFVSRPARSGALGFVAGSVIWPRDRARGLVATGVCDWCKLGIREETSFWSN